MDSKLDNLIEKLLAFGEDKKELEFWKGIWADLTPNEREKLMANLEEEIAELEKTK